VTLAQPAWLSRSALDERTVSARQRTLSVAIVATLGRLVLSEPNTGFELREADLRDRATAASAT